MARRKRDSEDELDPARSAATVTGADFSGMRKLADACGKRFIMGLVLYDHDTVVPFGEKFFAVPISTLWQ